MTCCKLNTFLFGALLACAPIHASILRADLHGFAPYSFYAGGQLSISTSASGHVSIDQTTGAGTMDIRLDVTGGPDAAVVGGIGAVHVGSVTIHFMLANVVGLWGALDALPNQPEWWGPNHANQVMFDLPQCVQVGVFGLGCGQGAAMSMGRLYQYQDHYILNHWLDWSTVAGIDGRAWSGDGVYYLDPIHSPEPGMWLLMSAGVAAVVGRRAYPRPLKTLAIPRIAHLEKKKREVVIMPVEQGWTTIAEMRCGENTFALVEVRLQPQPAGTHGKPLYQARATYRVGKRRPEVIGPCYPVPYGQAAVWAFDALSMETDAKTRVRQGTDALRRLSLIGAFTRSAKRLQWKEPKK